MIGIYMPSKYQVKEFLKKFTHYVEPKNTVKHEIMPNRISMIIINECSTPGRNQRPI
jgi:hypothetical protein